MQTAPKPAPDLLRELNVWHATAIVAGTIIGWMAYSEIASVGVAPTRTLEVLKQDQVWIQNEARTA